VFAITSPPANLALRGLFQRCAVTNSWIVRFWNLDRVSFEIGGRCDQFLGQMDIAVVMTPIQMLNAGHNLQKRTITTFVDRAALEKPYSGQIRWGDVWRTPLQAGAGRRRLVTTARSGDPVSLEFMGSAWDRGSAASWMPARAHGHPRRRRRGGPPTRPAEYIAPQGPPDDRLDAA